MTTRQAQRRLDRADEDLRMAGVSALGMSALYQDPDGQGRKLLVASREWIWAMKEFKRVKRRHRPAHRPHHHHRSA